MFDVYIVDTVILISMKRQILAVVAVQNMLSVVMHLWFDRFVPGFSASILSARWYQQLSVALSSFMWVGLRGSCNGYVAAR